MRNKPLLVLAVVSFFISCACSVCYATEDLTLLISGQSHANLYPCSCPSNPEGGVARRATTIKDIKKKQKNLLVLEAGLSFAGGSYDTQHDEETKKQRTEYYLKALSKMGYDAFLISNEEFNFGDDFLA